MSKHIDFRHLMLSCTALGALVLASCSQPTADAPAPDTVAPEQVITEPAPLLTDAGLATLDATLTELASTQQRAGFSAVIARNGEVLHTTNAGYADVEAERPMTADTLVRIASMSKPVTAAAIMLLVEDGVISLDDPVSDYIPAFANARVATSTARNEAYEIPTTDLSRPITIEDLMTHTSGIGYLFDFQTNLGALYIGNDFYRFEGDMDARMDMLAGLPLYFQPGQAWFYSYANDILGHVVAVASEQSLEAFCQSRFFEPLGMTDTTYFLREDQYDRIAVLYTHGEDGALTRVPDEEDGLRNSPVEAGGAGLWSTANDYVRFAQMLANGGEFDGTRIMSAESVRAMHSLHVGEDRMPPHMDARNRGFGYALSVIYDGAGNPGPRRIGDFGWTGFFDTEFIVSPETGLVAVLMSQEQPGPTTAETTSARSVFDQLVFGTLPQEG